MSRGRRLHRVTVISLIPSILITLTATPMQTRELHQVVIIPSMLLRLARPVPQYARSQQRPAVSCRADRLAALASPRHAAGRIRGTRVNEGTASLSCNSS
jgi:hypothetical protein